MTRNTSPWPCPRCYALPGHPCVHVATGFRQVPPGSNAHQFVAPGQPTLIMHRQRPRIRCIPLGETP